MPEFKKSTRKNKKYMVKVNNKWVHFGNLTPPANQHYKDTTGLGLYTHLNHGDKKRRDAYRKRHMAIKLKDGTYAYKNKEQPAYFSLKYLWT